MFHGLLDLLYPRTCLSCAQLLSPTARDLCASCWSSIERVGSSPTAQGPLADVVGLFVFEEESPVRALLHALKYGAMPSLATRLGSALGELIAERAVPGDILIPVPLSRRKKRERGFNQAASVAEGVSSVTGIRVAEGLVVRIRDTPSQTALSAESRRQNIRGAFAISELGAAELNGKRCLLIDDVVTTGATAHECASVLRSAGALSVIVCAVAIARRTPA